MKNLVSKKNFQILDHPADLKIKVWGNNLKDFFQNILTAIFSITNPETTDKKIKTKIEIKANDLENLVFNFLTELIYQMDINDTIFSEINFSKINEREIISEIKGKKIKKLDTEIKGITWHDFSVKKEKDGYTAILLFDI